MPVKKAAFKSIRQSAKRRRRNLSITSELKGRFKKIEKLTAPDKKELAPAEAQTLISKLDKAARKGVIHKNTASRKKAQIAKMLKSLSA